MAKKQILKAIVEKTKADSYHFIDPQQFKDEIEAGHIIVNHEIKDEKGFVAARSTTDQLGENLKTEAKATQTFDIVKGIKPPVAKRGGERKEVYPFSAMEVGDSILVPVSEKYPDPAKQLASTVSAAARRFATKTGETKTNSKGKTVDVLDYTKKFIIRPVTAGQGYEGSEFVEPSDGARIFRVQ
jgi:hypothetical protein